MTRKFNIIWEGQRMLCQGINVLTNIWTMNGLRNMLGKFFKFGTEHMPESRVKLSTFKKPERGHSSHLHRKSSMSLTY